MHGKSVFMLMAIIILFILPEFTYSFIRCPGFRVVAKPNIAEQAPFARSKVTTILSKVQWYISAGKDIIGTTNRKNIAEVRSYNYTPYGQTTAQLSVDRRRLWPVTGKKQCNTRHLKFNINNNPFRYSAYYLDSISDLYYLNARLYAPEFMRFISRDSYDLGNRYAYCNDDPVSQTDPKGHIPDWVNWTLAITAFVAGVVTAGLGFVADSGWAVAYSLAGGLSGAASGVFQAISTTKSGKSAEKFNRLSVVAGAIGLFLDLGGGGEAYLAMRDSGRPALSSVSNTLSSTSGSTILSQCPALDDGIELMPIRVQEVSSASTPSVRAGSQFIDNLSEHESFERPVPTNLAAIRRDFVSRLPEKDSRRRLVESLSGDNPHSLRPGMTPSEIEFIIDYLSLP